MWTRIVCSLLALVVFASWQKNSAICLASLGSDAVSAATTHKQYIGGQLMNYTLVPNTAAWEKTVLIVTGGRMGSTLVSGLVGCGIKPGCQHNADGTFTNPDVFMAGENYLALWYLFEFENALRKGYSLHLSNAGVKNARGARNPWYHTPDPRILEDQIQMMVQSYFLQEMTSSRIVGFKEVRWYQKSETRPTKKQPQTTHSARDLADFILWINKYVPNLYVVFNLRNAEATSKSGWWRGQRGSLDVIKDLRRELQEVYQTLRSASDKSGSGHFPKAYMLDYDQDILNHNVSHLYTFLNEEFHVNLVDEVFQSTFSGSSHKTKYSNLTVHATR